MLHKRWHEKSDRKSKIRCINKSLKKDERLRQESRVRQRTRKRDKNNGLVVNGSEEWHRNSFKAIVNSLTHDCGRRRRRPLFAAFLSDIVWVERRFVTKSEVLKTTPSLTPTNHLQSTDTHMIIILINQLNFIRFNWFKYILDPQLMSQTIR